MKTKLTIKEKIQYLTRLETLLKILSNQLEEAQNDKADYMLKQQNEPDNIWIADAIQEETYTITALKKLIEDLENLTE